MNNAARARSTRFPDLTAEEFRATVELNLTVPFLLTRAVLPAIKAQGYGRVINISSSAGRMVSTLHHGRDPRQQRRRPDDVTTGST